MPAPFRREISLSEAAMRLGVSYVAARGMVIKGRFRARQAVGRSWIVTPTTWSASPASGAAPRRPGGHHDDAAVSIHQPGGRAAGPHAPRPRRCRGRRPRRGAARRGGAGAGVAPRHRPAAPRADRRARERAPAGDDRPRPLRRGPRPQVEDLRRRIRERVTGIMARSYDADERRYLERFAPPSPPRTLATDDANRITVALAQARLLRADEFVNQLLEAAATTDYPLLRGLLPVARSFADREAVRHAGIGPAIQLAEAVLAGAHGHAHQRAHEVAPQVRRQVETVARTLMAEGRWHGTTFARMEPSPVPDLGLTAVEA